MTRRRNGKAAPGGNDPRAASPFNDWQTTRYELLNTRICELDVRIEGSRVEPFVLQLYKELAAKRLRFRPPVYFTDTWGCPDRVPTIGIPFYLADDRLKRIEEEQTGEVEDARTIRMYLRHEAAHAFNYAYRLWEFPEWEATFGPFRRPYRLVFRPQPGSRDYVRHLPQAPFGRTYAQRHPDEDFAETFAVWLTPRSGWRRRYRLWPALAKLRCVDRWMRRVRGLEPRRVTGSLLNPVERMDVRLADHYGERAEKFRSAAQGYVDDRLLEVFAAPPPGRGEALADLLRANRPRFLDRMARWSGIREEDVSAILSKLEERSTALKIRYAADARDAALADAAAMATALAMDFAYTGTLRW